MAKRRSDLRGNIFCNSRNVRSLMTRGSQKARLARTFITLDVLARTMKLSKRFRLSPRLRASRPQLRGPISLERVGRVSVHVCVCVLRSLNPFIKQPKDKENAGKYTLIAWVSTSRECKDKCRVQPVDLLIPVTHYLVLYRACALIVALLQASMDHERALCRRIGRRGADVWKNGKESES